MLGVDESTLRRWADNGQVRAFRTLGGHRRFAEPDIRELLAGGRDGQRYRELGELAVTRIRRQLHTRPAREASWYATVDEPAGIASARSDASSPRSPLITSGVAPEGLDCWRTRVNSGMSTVENSRALASLCPKPSRRSSSSVAALTTRRSKPPNSTASPQWTPCRHTSR